MMTMDWVFLTELLVLLSAWMMMCAWNDQFNNKTDIEHFAREIIQQKYSENSAAEQPL
jgi:hypothetical protein